MHTCSLQIKNKVIMREKTNADSKAFAVFKKDFKNQNEREKTKTIQPHHVLKMAAAIERDRIGWS